MRPPPPPPLPPPPPPPPPPKNHGKHTPPPPHRPNNLHPPPHHPHTRHPQPPPTPHSKAFTAIQIIHVTRIARLSIREVLQALREAGLDSMPGGGAEIFDDRVHDEVFKGKVRADKWFEVHRTAHSLGIPSNATMLYGHVETPEERVGHFVKLRELQEESLERQGSEGLGFRVQGSGKGGTAAGSASSLNPEPRTLNALHPACFTCVIPLSFI